MSPLDPSIAHLVKRERTPLDLLSEDIAEAHRRVVQHADVALRYAIEAGELLLEAKQQLPHGGWEPWLTANLPDDMGLTIARIYMRLATHKEKIESENPRSIRAAMQLLGGEPNQSINTNKRNDAIALHSAHEDLTVREIAERVGASPSSVQLWLNSGTRRKAERRYLTHRKRKVVTCPHCGGKLHIDGSRATE